MNINKTYIIIFGTLVLSIIIIMGAITISRESNISSSTDDSKIYGYHLLPPIEKEGQDQVSDERQNFFTLSQSYPANFRELSGFIHFCKNTLFSGVDRLKDDKIKQVACLLTKMSPGSIDLYGFSSRPYLPRFFVLKDMISFERGNYIGISVDLKDVLREYDPSLLQENKLYFCSVSEPSLTDPFILQLESKYDLFFDEGDVSCEGIKMNEASPMIFVGLVPRAESLSIKQYLVDEQTVSDVMNKQSFSEIKEILKDYPIIWQMEKPINL